MRVCVSGAGGEGGDGTDCEKSKLSIRNSGFQPSCTPTCGEVLPSLDPNCPVCKMEVMADGRIPVMEV